MRVMLHAMVRALSALVFVALATGPVRAASDLPSRIGMYPTSAPAKPLAMLDSDVVVHVHGPIAEVTITQTFKNDADHVTEATYIFPLPPDAAVSAMEITTGSRVVRASIEKREAAVARYEKAVAAGISAGLLEQERPDVFTQTVSAIPAKGEVKVALRFDTVARYDHGAWVLAMPLVVAPRYVPGTASGRSTSGTGRAPDTDRAPDASRVTPGGSPGAGGKTDVRIEFGEAVDDVKSSTHELTKAGEAYTLSDAKTDHDVVVRWREKTPQQGWVEAGDDGGFAAVLVEAKPAQPRKRDLEVTLVLDRSATTRGDAEAVERATVRALFAALTTKDSIAVAGTDTLAAAAPDATLRALDERWSEKAPAFDLTKVLSNAKTERAIVLVTDGLVADDQAALSAAKKLGAAIHVIGVGPAPNRSLLTQIATTTGGTIRFATIGDDLAALGKDVVADMASPPGSLPITWGTLGATDVVPATQPVVGSGQALLVVAHVKKAQSANARVRGDVFAFATITPPKAPPGATSTRGPLARRWAKSRLDELVATGTPAAVAQHALRYGLVSPQTAMVAIGSDVIVEGGVKHSVAVPVSVPEGMQWQLVKKQTTVETTTAQTEVDAKNARKKAGKTKEEKDTEHDEEDSRAKYSSASGEGVDAAPSEEPLPGPPDGGGMNEPTSVAMSPERGEDEDAEETIAFRSAGSRRAIRLALSLGAGLTHAGGESLGIAAIGARAELVRHRILIGLDTSLWLVDGLHGEGGVLVMVGSRLTHKLEVAAGPGVRFTGDAVGPAAALVLRFTLPLRGFAGYLRYDGALLQQDNSATGQNTGSFGIEARW